MIRWPSLWIAVGLLVVFAALCQIPPLPLGESLRAFVFALSVAIASSFAKPAFHAFTRKTFPDHVGQLAMGIFLLWTSMAIQSFWYVLWRVAGQPLWMFNNDFNSFTLYLFSIGGALHVTAPGALDGVIPARNMIKIGISLGVAALFLAFVMLASDSATAFVEFLHPFFED
jgi:hypothetical protein